MDVLRLEVTFSMIVHIHFGYKNVLKNTLVFPTARYLVLLLDLAELGLECLYEGLDVIIHFIE